MKDFNDVFSLIPTGKVFHSLGPEKMMCLLEELNRGCRSDNCALELVLKFDDKLGGSKFLDSLYINFAFFISIDCSNGSIESSLNSGDVHVSFFLKEMMRTAFFILVVMLLRFAEDAVPQFRRL